jgi:2-polyprenyl-6-methoxyphenol hydroxylase-like FAD-dependent oxidoreductase
VRRHIAIVGYGTAGAALAVLLARDGHRVEVFEQSARPGPVGAGLLLQPTGMVTLEALGLLDAALQHGAVVKRLYGETPSGRPVMDMRYAQLDSRLYGLGMQRGALYELLHTALPDTVHLHCGQRIQQVLSARGRVIDAHGRSHGPFDLVVAADGAASVLRDALREQDQVRLDQPFPWGALWCLLPAAAWPWPDELRQRYRQARQMLGMLPVGTRPGDAQPRLSFFWSMRGADFARWRAQPLDDWRAQLEQLWPQFAPHAQLLRSHEQLATARYRDVRLGACWHHERLVLIGDAAHAMSPQLGQGVNMALLDALALRDALRGADTLPGALVRFARQRQQHVWIYQFWSRWLTPLFQSEGRTLAALRDLLFHPLGRLPGGRRTMLRVLTGTRRGIWGALALPESLLDKLAAHWHREHARRVQT